MTAAELLRRLHEEATPGPWEPSQGREGAFDHVAASMLEPEEAGPDLARCYGWRKVREPNARLIATVRTLLPELIAVVEAARGCRDLGPFMRASDCAVHDALIDAASALDARAAEVAGE